MMLEILVPISILGGVGLFMGCFLAFASKKFEVEVDPNVEKIGEILPGVNCGACGYPGCGGYAEAVALNGADINACAPGGGEVASKIADIMGMTADVSGDRKVARVLCQGDKDKVSKLYDFDVEIKTCATAMLYYGGDKSCWHSCLGYGDCSCVCPVDAIEIGDGGIAKIIEDKCVSCGKCVAECPKNVIKLVPENQEVTVCCNSKEKGAIARKNCNTACLGCGVCQRACPVDAIDISLNLATIDAQKCISCGLCAIKCPTKAIINNSREFRKAEIKEDKCIGCTACKRVCPVEAIEGEVKEKHKVSEEKCIGCQLCFDKCKFGAITIKSFPR